MTPEQAAAFHRPRDGDEYELPPREPYHGEMVAGWIGRRPQDDGPLADAWDSLGPLGTWCALALLEEPDARPEPTASLADRISEHETALKVIAEIAEEHASLARTETGEEIVCYPAEHVRVAKQVTDRIAIFKELSRSRRIDAERLAGLASPSEEGPLPRSSRGPRGFWSPAERMRRFVKAVQPLRDRQWTWRQLAKLVIDSAAWGKPPSRKYVAALLEDAEFDRDRAVGLLIERLKAASKRSKSPS